MQDVIGLIVQNMKAVLIRITQQMKKMSTLHEQTLEASWSPEPQIKRLNTPTVIKLLNSFGLDLENTK